MDDAEREIERLQRIDHRLNKELVSKPFKYIDKVRDTIDREQKNIVDIIKNNNERYLTKIS